jgi:hypothetical protein
MSPLFLLHPTRTKPIRSSSVIVSITCPAKSVENGLQVVVDGMFVRVRIGVSSIAKAFNGLESELDLDKPKKTGKIPQKDMPSDIIQALPQNETILQPGQGNRDREQRLSCHCLRRFECRCCCSRCVCAVSGVRQTSA